MLRLPITNYTLCASWDEQAPYYSLLLEEGECGAKKSGRRLAEEVDGRLAEANIEYEETRASGRVGPVRIKIVPPGALTAFDEGLIEARSNRLEQYKHRFLENSVEFEKQFEIRRTISSDGGATRTLGKPQGQVEQL
jgi:hypothetical protein